MKVRVRQQVEIEIDMDFTSREMEQGVYNKARDRIEAILIDGIGKRLPTSHYRIPRNVNIHIQPLCDESLEWNDNENWEERNA